MPSSQIWPKEIRDIGRFPLSPLLDLLGAFPSCRREEAVPPSPPPLLLLSVDLSFHVFHDGYGGTYHRSCERNFEIGNRCWVGEKKKGDRIQRVNCPGEIQRHKIKVCFRIFDVAIILRYCLVASFTVSWYLGCIYTSAGENIRFTFKFAI